MKESNKTTQFAIRVLSDFSNKLIELLKEKPLEDISVHAICLLCHYPRSTFYNYFDDIYDLMDYCWKIMIEDMELEKYLEGKNTLETFSVLYDYLSNYREDIRLITTKNPIDGRCMNSLRHFMRNTIKEVIRQCPESKAFPIREDIMIDYYALIIEMILEKCFFEVKPLSKEDALKSVQFLLITIEKEVHKE